MTETGKVKSGLDLSKLPDWVKILIFLMGTFAAGGGGATLGGTDYGPRFEKLESQLEKIVENDGEMRDRVTRLEVKIENLEKAK